MSLAYKRMGGRWEGWVMPPVDTVCQALHSVAHKNNHSALTVINYNIKYWYLKYVMIPKPGY